MLPFKIRRDLLRSVTRKSVRPRTPSFCQQSISSIAQGSSIIYEQSRSKPTLFSFQNNHEAKFRFQSFRELNASVILNHEEDVMEIPPMNHSFDKPSRYLLSLLDDILAGRSSGMENITTERCNAAIASLLEEGSPSALQRAELILYKMEQIGKEQGQNSQTANPNFFTYWSIMRTYLRKGQEKHTNKAYSLLKRMEFAVNGSFCSASMTTANDRFHRCFIFTKPASGIEEKNRAELCESAFMKLTKPDTKTFNWILHLWAKSSREDSARRAEELLRKVSEMGSENEKFSECRPDIFSFNTVISAYAEKGEGEKAESMLGLMGELHELGMHDFEPDIISYISTLSAWYKSRSNPYERAKQADKILNIILKQFNEKESKSELKPHLFVMAIKLWGKCKNEEGVLRTEKILSQMEQRSVKLNTIVYNAYLETIANSDMKNADAKAEEIIETMKKKHKDGNAIKPDLVSYTSYIKTLFSNMPSKNYEKPLRVIKTLEHEFDEGISDIEPDATLYSTLLSICYKMDVGGDVTDEILQHMERRFETGYTKAKPTLWCYQTGMKSWLMSSDPRKGQKVYDILLKCEDTENLSLWDYNLVLATCAKVKKASQKQKNITMSTAIEVFRKIQNSSELKPSSQTYYSLLEACGNLIPNRSKQNNAIEIFFDHCKKDGMVNSNILMLIGRICTTKFQVHLLGGENKKFNDLPSSWTSNSGGNEGQVRLGRTHRQKLLKKIRN